MEKGESSCLQQSQVPTSKYGGSFEVRKLVFCKYHAKDWISQESLIEREILMKSKVFCMVLACLPLDCS